MKIGDKVERVTKALGIKPCALCLKRRDALNKIDPTGKTGFEVAKAMLEAIRDPDEVLNAEEENDWAETGNQEESGIGIEGTSEERR